MLFCFASIGLSAQPLTRPDDFLGYRLGERFTPHARIIEYYRLAERSQPRNLRLFSYGKTPEGRELVYAVVSAPNNMARWEEIQANNQRLCGRRTDRAGDPSLPGVVWLSFNVHGNEPSSSEVALQLLYDLVSGNHPELSGWLQNTVVILDPCLNPDGRDRYVNWFNQVSGKYPEANPLAREHQEPWPGGRTNHYYFDLNRDWAWQTQPESRGRIAAYLSWMPAIHADYHEQGVNAPYYFAPAAEPFHEVISPWQRDFQSQIGRNHATYFDQKGWLYFTREYFDLFYPSYGDTYPLFNGSIGMTYEQAGHSTAGVSVSVGEDTLTLKQRVAHHLATAYSTIQMASQNARALNEQLAAYFSKVRTEGSGPYKTYLVDASDPARLSALTDLLKRNGIEYSYARADQKFKGFHYLNGKEEGRSARATDLLVSTCQSAGHLVRVLFEPQSRLSDSVTYDITAWSVPYAYGMDAYALRERLEGQEAAPPVVAIPTDDKAYAYLIHYRSFASARLVSSLLLNGCKLSVSEVPFSFGGTEYPRGTVMFLRHENSAQLPLLYSLATQMKVRLTPIRSGFTDRGFDPGSDKFHRISKSRVALITGPSSNANAAGEIWDMFDNQLEYPLVVLPSDDLSAADLRDLDVIIFPDGQYKVLAEKESALKNWVKQGGRLVVIDGALSQLAAGDWGIKLKKEESGADDKKPSYADIRKYANRERESISGQIPGAIYRVELDDTHPLAFGYPDHYFTLKKSGLMTDFMTDGWNVGVIRQQAPVAGFVGDQIRQIIRDGAVLGAKDLGAGRILFFADDPVFRGFWENGKLLLFNAIFMTGY